MILSDTLIYPYRSFKYSKWWRRKLGHTQNTDLLHICARFVVEINENLAIIAGFNTI